MLCPGLAAQRGLLLGSSLAVGRGRRGGVGGSKEVLERGVVGGQVLACGAGRWLWALV